MAAKRKGVVNGVDYQHTGVVRFVQTDALRRQLDGGSIVLLSNLGYVGGKGCGVRVDGVWFGGVWV